MHASTDEETIEQITAKYPGWHLWWSRDADGKPGELMATRLRDLTDEELKAGLSCTLPVGYGTDVRTQLAEQAESENARGGAS